MGRGEGRNFPQREKIAALTGEHAGPEITGSHVGQGTWFQLLQGWENPHGPGLSEATEPQACQHQGLGTVPLGSDWWEPICPLA